MARRLVRLTAGPAAYCAGKRLSKGRRHLATGQIRHRTTSRLERHNRELRRRAGYRRDGTQPAGTAANPGPAQTNHLTGNATRRGGQVAKPPDTA